MLLPGLEETNVYYVGTAKPKLLFLVNASRPHAPEVYVAAATAYSESVPLGIVPLCCQLAWSIKWQGFDSEFGAEHRDGQWVLNVGAYHCQQQGRPVCFLARIRQISACPWHPALGEKDTGAQLQAIHFLCTKRSTDSEVRIVGPLINSLTTGAIWILHVCTEEQLDQMHDQVQPVHSPTPIFMSTLSEALVSEEYLGSLVAPFRDVALPRELFRRFFVKAGGPASTLPWTCGSVGGASHDDKNQAMFC